VSTGRSRNTISAAVELAITVSFLVLAGWFLLGPQAVRVPHAIPAEVTPAQILTTPLRRPLGDTPTVRVAGFDMKCMECHALFESRPETARRLTQHAHIVLDHGLNDRCFNCHDNAKRDRLSLRGDRTIPFSQVARLCAKCHGPTYRDWEMGIHGRTMGSWDQLSGVQQRLICSECHDPHAPAFPSFFPLPGPDTLRMGVPKDRHDGGPVESIDPLRKWQHGQKRLQTPVAPEDLLPEHSVGDRTADSEGTL